MIVQILMHTPPWVFGLFLGLAYLGYLQSKTRAISRARLAVLPIAMLGLSLLGVWSSFGASVVGFSAWAGALAAAIVIGLGIRAPTGAAYNDDSGLFTVPGSWIPLALMMGIFFTKYAVAVARATSGLPSLPIAIVATACAICGACSGVFFVRALRAMRAARRSTGDRAVGPV